MDSRLHYQPAETNMNITTKATECQQGGRLDKQAPRRISELTRETLLNISAREQRVVEE